MLVVVSATMALSLWDRHCVIVSVVRVFIWDPHCYWSVLYSCHYGSVTA